MAKNVSRLSALHNRVTAELNAADHSTVLGVRRDLSLHAEQFNDDTKNIARQLEAKEMQLQDAERILGSMNNFKELNMILTEKRANAVLATRDRMAEKLFDSTNMENPS
ncbi:hypothetical protein FACS1894154_11360 [Betaproteobacteria bacterium]|nr:hypothetical protein FACS1894154_11360 [Betaproteobacteria bacterium]GHU25379.1 hypothetical protein FACS189488_12280 [Betaproteobacteria bacterium]